MSAEIKRADVYDDDLMAAPGIMTKDLEKYLVVLKQVAAVGKTVSASMTVSSSGNLGKAREDTEKLTKAQQELVKVQNQIATVVAKENEAYIKLNKQLQEAKQALKEKQQLGDKDALTINKQIASIEELGAALKKNQVAYAKLRTEEERNSKSGQQLLKVIQQQDKEFKQLRGQMGIHTDKVGDYEGAMRKLKGELKAAQDEMAGIARSLGTDSKEFVAAAEKAGALKDEIGDLKESANAVAGSPLENLGGSLGTVTSKLKSLDFKGASDAAKQFAAVSKTLTMKEAISGLGGFGTTLGTVGKAILKNPLFIMAAILIGVSVAVYKLRDSIKPLKIMFEAVGDAIEWTTQQLKDFADWLGIASFAADEKAEKIVAAANKEIDAIQKRYDREIAIAEAAGKDVTAMEVAKWKAVIDEATKGMVELHAKRERNNNKLEEEDQKAWDEFVEIVADANTQIQVVENTSAEERRKKREEDAKKRKDQEEKEWQEFLKRRAERLKEEDQYFNTLINGAASFATEQQKILNEAIQAERNLTLHRLQDTELSQLERRKIIQDSQEAILALQKEYAKKTLDAQIDALNLLLTTEKDLTINQKKKVNEIIAELNQKRTELELIEQEDSFHKQLIAVENFLLRLKGSYDKWGSAIGSLFNTLTARRLENIEAEHRAEDERFEAQLKALEETRASQKATEEEKAAFEEKKEATRKSIEADREAKQKIADKQRLEAQQRQAKFEKAAGVTKAIIEGSLAVLHQLGSGDPYTAIPRAIAAGAFAGIQIATIIAQPIPKYEKGAKPGEHPGGLAIVGEAGSELIRHNGQLSISPASPTLMNLPAGAEVIPNKETMEMLAMSGIYNMMGRNQVSDTYALEKKMDNNLAELKNITQAIKNKKEFHLKGQVTGYKKGGNHVKYIDLMRNS